MTNLVKRLPAALLAFFILISASGPAQGAEATARVLVLPFKMNAPSDATYLQQGILDMLTSRLEWQGRVDVVPRAEARQAFNKANGEIDKAAAASLAEELGANFVLYGAVTMLGQNVSLDANMLDLEGGRPPINLFTQSEGLDGVIPKINQFAEEINTTVFGRQSRLAASSDSGSAAPPAAAETEPAEQEKSDQPVPAYRRHPDYLLSGYEGQTLSPLNPNFVAAVGSDEREGAFWRSPSLPLALIGLVVADIDNDGQNEIIYASRQGVFINRISEGRFERLAGYEGSAADRFLTLDVIDADENGRPEIYVSNQRRTQARSLVLDFKDNKLTPRMQDVPYYFRVITRGNEYRKLVGQRGGNAERFYGGVYYMRYENGQLVQDKPLNLPKGVDVFRFAVARLSGSEKEHLIVVNERERLVILTRGGQELWKSREYFGGTMNYLAESYNMTDSDFSATDEGPKRYYLPSRILIEDLNHDDQPEIIISRNEQTSVSSWMSRWRAFDRGAIHSLSYDQMTVRENWRSRRLPGVLSDYQVADFDNNGRDDLVAAVVMDYGEGGLSGARSAIVAYELASAEEMKEAEKKRVE